MLVISFLWPKNKIKKLIHLFNKKRFVLQQIILCSFVVSVSNAILSYCSLKLKSNVFALSYLLVEVQI